MALAQPLPPAPAQVDPRALAAARSILEILLPAQVTEVAVRLWDGTLGWGAPEAPCILHLRHPAPLRELILKRSLFRLVDAYLAGHLEVEGEMEKLFDLQAPLEKLQLPLAARLRLARLALRLPGYGRGEEPAATCRLARPGENCRRTIAHHYDVSNDFYRLWLDPEMVYSCAYFTEPHEDLARAQRDKLEYICRKLRLEPGQRLLDIGCGWGGLALWAARHHGVRVHGITLSRQQYELARRRVREAGLEDRVTIELRDYRDLDMTHHYHRVVSVGMFEHIGVRNFPVYFETIARVMRPDGLFLNHGITSADGWGDSVGTRFINHYIFPDGELATLHRVIEAMEQAGFETIDVENLRRHYQLTLRLWVRNLEARREEAIAASDPATWRLWRLYMAGSAHRFGAGHIALHQILAARRHQPQPLPLTRADLYRS